jgi:uncharacterized protein YbbC (DUF1343 family)
MLSTAKKLYPDSMKWRNRSIDRLSGTPLFRKAVDSGMAPQTIVEMWMKPVEEFKSLRAKYLLYPR